jgi:uncharacterized protein YqjF (DUF2071 family)
MGSYPAIEPVRPAVMVQQWRRLTFIHWRYPAPVIAARLPAGLAVDTCDGSAWVGLTPFLLSGLRPPLLPPLPWISRFPETNLRTCVTGPDGRRGIWFFSLDAARAPAVAVARAAYGLPYAWSNMRVEFAPGRAAYASRRIWPDTAARARIEIEHGGAAGQGGLEIFLTARFTLYSLLFGHLIQARVEHEPWPLETARARKLDQTLTAAAGLPPPSGPPLIHFSPGVTARIGPPRRTGRIPR